LEFAFCDGARAEPSLSEYWIWGPQWARTGAGKRAFAPDTCMHYPMTVCHMAGVGS